MSMSGHSNSIISKVLLDVIIATQISFIYKAIVTDHRSSDPPEVLPADTADKPLFTLRTGEKYQRTQDESIQTAIL